jgi:hypothetical protein
LPAATTSAKAPFPGWRPDEALALIVTDYRLLRWRLIEARTPGEIAQLEDLAGITQRAAVDYAIERSGLRDCFPGFAGGKGTPAARLVAARRFSSMAIVYLVAGSPLMRPDALSADEL